MDSKNLQKSRKRFENKSCNKVHFQISKDFFSCLVDVSSETENAYFWQIVPFFRQIEVLQRNQFTFFAYYSLE